jgi:hypothetical protein
MNSGHSAGRFRPLDAVALAGFAALSVGAALFKFGANYVPAWLAWLVAPLLWYVGFGMLVGWAFARMMGVMRRPHSRVPANGSIRRAEPAGTKPNMSNFVEHDFVLEPVKVKETL